MGRGSMEGSGEREELGWAGADLQGNCPLGVVVLHFTIRPFVPKNEVDQERVDWFTSKGPWTAQVAQWLRIRLPVQRTRV